MARCTYLGPEDKADETGTDNFMEIIGLSNSIIKKQHCPNKYDQSYIWDLLAWAFNISSVVYNSFILSSRQMSLFSDKSDVHVIRFICLSITMI